MQTAKASRKQSSLSGKESAQGCIPIFDIRASQVAQWVKNPSAMQEMQVRSLGWEDPLEKGRTSHSSILAWRILWTEETVGLQSIGLQRVGPEIPAFPGEEY